MRTGIAVTAVLIVAVTWGVAISHIRRPPAAVVPNHTGESEGALDESRINKRPIGYPVLETASLQLAQALLSFSSENGVLYVRSIGADLTVPDALGFNSLLNPRILGQALSTRPVAGVGTVVWQRSLYRSPAVFKVVTTASTVSVYDSSGKRLWRLQSPRPDYTVSVDDHNRGELTDKSGTVLWKGDVDKRIAGYSLSSTNGNVSLTFGTIHLVLDPAVIRLSVASARSWTGQAHGSTTIVALKAPGTSSMLCILVGFQKSAFLSWRPGLRTRTTISIDHGRVTVSEPSGRVSGTHPVDIASMSTTMVSADTPDRSNVVVSGLLVTPLMPLYINGATIDAKYATARGRNVAEETIHYQLGVESASVTRAIASTGANRGTSTMSLMYPAPISPASTTWTW